MRTTVSFTDRLRQPSGRRTPLAGILVIAGATTAMALGFGSLALTSIFLRPLEAEFGWSRAQISFAYTLATLGMAVGGLWWGRLSDRVDIRLLQTVGSACIVASLFIMSAASSLWQLYAANLLLGGFGFACLYAPMLAVTGLWFERRRGLAVGIVTAGGALGQGAIPYAANIMIDALGWRMAFGGLAVFALAALAISMPLIRRPPGHDGATACSGAPAVAGPATNRTDVGLLSAAAFLCCACMGVPLVHLASFVTAVCGSSAAGSTSLLVAMLFGTVGRVFFGVVADRIGYLPAYALASLMQTLCVIAYPALDSQASILTLSAVFGFGFAGNMTCLILCVREAVPFERFGRSLGIVMLVAWAGMGAGGYAGGLVFDRFGTYTLSFVAAFAAGVLNLAVIALLGARRRAMSDRGGMATAAPAAA